MTYSEVLSLLNGYAHQAKFLSGDNLTLDRMWPLLQRVGNPQDSLRAIHIAGTSGKTSTAYYIADRLHKAGCTVGLTVSPHVDSITERVQLNGSPISEEEFAASFSEFYELAKAGNSLEPVSYFELLVVFELWFFAKQAVDYAVIETGMGGLLDGTNVLRRRDKLCVITDIGFDHMHVLGNTLSAIASQKAGIIHEDNTVFMYRQDDEIMQQIEKRATEKNARVFFVDEPVVDKKLALPLFQQRNVHLAREVVAFIAKRDELVLGSDDVSIQVPGRMERLEYGSTELVLDGAHNQQKMQVFVESYKAAYGNEKVPVLLALKEGKEYTDVVDALQAIASLLVLTDFSTAQDMPVRAMNPQIITDYAKEQGISAIIEPDQKKALRLLLADKPSRAIITGSFYLLGQIRQLL